MYDILTKTVSIIMKYNINMQCIYYPDIIIRASNYSKKIK